MVTEQAVRTPGWLAEFGRAYQSGEALGYILSGDVHGVAYEGQYARDILLGALAARWDVVAVYHIAGGVSICLPDDELPSDAARAGAFADDDPGRFDSLKRRDWPAESRKQRALRMVGAADAPPQDPSAGAGAGGNALAALMQGLGPRSAEPDDPFEAARRPVEAVALLQQLLQRGDSVAVVIEHADALAPAPPMAGKGAMSPEDRRILVSLLTWPHDPAINERGNPAILLCRDAADLHPDLRSADSGWRGIVAPLPDRAARAEYLGWYLAMRERAGKPIPLLDDLAAGELANLTAGLSLRNVEDVLLAAAQAGGLTRAELKAHKDRIVSSSYSEVAEMIDPIRGGFDAVGGMEVFKDYCRRRVIKHVRAGNDQSVPKGILLVGPPGTGKTYGVAALAGEVGWTAVKLQADKILGGIVGESERKLGTALNFVRSLRPCLLFVDEIDQSDLAQRGNTSGNPVAKNLFSMLMQFMSDETNRGGVILILASNRPDILDAALIRSGRIDAILPMLLPERDQRRAIALAQVNLQGATIVEQALDLIAERTEGWNAADLAEVVREARLLAEDDGARDIAVAHARAALDDLRPSGLDKAEWFTNLALQAVNKKSLLPAKYRALLDNRRELEERAAQLSPAGGKEPNGARGARGERAW